MKKEENENEEKDISVNEEEVVDKTEKGGEDVESAADMEIDEPTVLAFNNVKNEESDTAQLQQSMEIDSTTAQQQLSSEDSSLKKAKTKEPSNEQPHGTNENVSTAATEHSPTLPNDNASYDSMLPSMAEDKGTNSATALSNEEEPSLPPALSEAYEQTNETKKTNELPASNTSKNGGSDFVQWPSDIAIASPAAMPKQTRWRRMTVVSNWYNQNNKLKRRLHPTMMI